MANARSSHSTGYKFKDFSLSLRNCASWMAFVINNNLTFLTAKYFKSNPNVVGNNDERYRLQFSPQFHQFFLFLQSKNIRKIEFVYVFYLPTRCVGVWMPDLVIRRNKEKLRRSPSLIVWTGNPIHVKKMRKNNISARKQDCWFNCLFYPFLQWALEIEFGYIISIAYSIDTTSMSKSKIVLNDEDLTFVKRNIQTWKNTECN